MNEYLAMWKNYFNFGGRTNVKGYWMAVLFNVIAMVFLGFLVVFSKLFAILYVIYVIAIIIPSVALIVRRLHDINKSGFWFFISFIPFGGILLLIWFCSSSVNENNRFGIEQI